jgi:hypothetical protein
MRYADDSCRSALLQRLLPLREREPYGAALDMRFASETQPDRNPLLPYVRFRAANFDRQPSARGRSATFNPHPPTDGRFVTQAVRRERLLF